YEGGTIAIKKRFSRGLSFDSAYTFGKIVDGSDIGGGGNESNSNVADITNLRRERALAVFDVRQRVVFSTLWQLPSFGFAGSGLARKVFDGWQASNVTILQSGTPYSVICTTPFIPVRDANGVIVGNSGCDYNADGYNYDYPNQPTFGNFKGGSRSAYINGLFKASDFPAPPLGVEGNLGRDTFIGPGFVK